MGFYEPLKKSTSRIQELVNLIEVTKLRTAITDGSILLTEI